MHFRPSHTNRNFDFISIPDGVGGELHTVQRLLSIHAPLTRVRPKYLRERLVGQMPAYQPGVAPLRESMPNAIARQQPIAAGLDHLRMQVEIELLQDLTPDERAPQAHALHIN